MPYCDGRADIAATNGITSFGTETIYPHLSDYLFTDKWTAKVFAVPGQGLQNVGGTGWVGGVSQVTEHTTDPAPTIWQQTSLLNYLIANGLIKPALEISWNRPEIVQPIGHQAIFYPRELAIDYGNWLTQVYKDSKGIAAFTDLGNYTYQGTYNYPPTNLSQEKLGSTVEGLKRSGLLKS